MRTLCFFLAVINASLTCTASSNAQDKPQLETALRSDPRQKAAALLPPPQGLQDHVAGGKLVLALDDGVRLALANNTDILLDHSRIDFAQNNLGRAHAPFDPLATSSFADTRAKSLTTSQLQGASILNNLTQTTQLGYQQTFPTGTSFQTAFSANKFSTNSSFNTVNPSLATAVQFTLTQPLVRNFGLFPNRAPILIAQRNLRQARLVF